MCKQCNGGNKWEYRRKYLSEHTKNKHPGERESYKLSLVIKSNKNIAVIFAGQLKAAASGTKQKSQKPDEPTEILYQYLVIVINCIYENYILKICTFSKPTK